jgi:hypothetical protein
VRKISIIPALAFSAMTFGLVVEAMPASAETVEFAGVDEDEDEFQDVAEESSGGAGAPEGGAATGAGGTLTGDAGSAAPFLAAGAAGIGLLGMSAATRRLRAVDARP